MKPILTSQGLASSIYDAMEFGFKACERGDNLDKARSLIAPHVKKLTESASNCPKEIIRIEFRKHKRTKISTVLSGDAERRQQ